MHSRDIAGFAVRSLAANWRRTLLIALATAIGVASVLLLSALGEGARKGPRISIED